MWCQNALSVKSSRLFLSESKLFNAENGISRHDPFSPRFRELIFGLIQSAEYIPCDFRYLLSLVHGVEQVGFCLQVLQSNGGLAFYQRLASIVLRVLALQTSTACLFIGF